MNPALVHLYNNIYIPACLQMIVTINFSENQVTGFPAGERAEKDRIL
jgi:hypothetical protein